MLTQPAERACRVCPKRFVPVRPLQSVCGLRCAQREASRKRKEAEAREKEQTRARRDAIRPLSYWVKQAQTSFNAWIRHRDAGKACISCGRQHGGKVNAGHFLSTGARPELRFDEANVHLQCEPCNTHLAGNLIPYRAELIRRIGQAEVDRLEGPHEPKRYRADELKAIRDEYRARLKAEQA